MNKKGIAWYLGIIPQLLIGGLILAVVMLLLFPSILNALAGDDTLEAARINFDLLTNEVQGMLDSVNDFEHSEILYNLPEGYALVGFDSDDTKVELNLHANVWKPDKCLEQACLCLYKEMPATDSEDKQENVLRCELFEGNTIFLASYGGLQGTPSEITSLALLKGADRDDIELANPDEYQYEYLFFHFTTEEAVSTLTGDYYVAKVEKDDFNYIIISPLANEFDRFYQNFQFCPENSDEICKNKPYDSIVTDPETGETYWCHYDDEIKYRCIKKEADSCELNQEADKRCVCNGDLLKIGDICSETQ